MSIDIEELESRRTDYRRANGAPQIVDRDGKNQRFSRPSSYGDILDDDSALTSWKIDRACIGTASDRALQARWVAVDPDDPESRKAKAKLREDSISAGRGAEAADIGTALHAMTVRWEQDPKFSPPQPYLQSLEAYEEAMGRLGLRSMRFEYHVVNEQYRCAGTCDRLYEATIALRTPDGELLPPGTLITADIKTGGKLEFSMPAYAVQTCLYTEGQWYDVETDTFLDTPTVNQDWAIIVHMPANEPGLCEMLWVDLEVGRWGCYLVDQVKRWRKMWRSGEFNMPAVEADYDMAVLLDEPPRAVVPDVVGEPVEAVPPDPAYGLADYTAWFKLRLNYIAINQQARQRLSFMWPAGLPTPKQGIGDEHVGPIDRLLSQIEAEFELGFVEGGPVKELRSTHQHRKE